MKKEIKYYIKKSLFPDENGTYILWKHSKSSRGESWRGMFKGTRKDCLLKKKEYLINI